MKKIFKTTLFIGLSLFVSKTFNAQESNSDSLIEFESDYTAEDLAYLQSIDSIISTLKFDSLGSKLILNGLVEVTIPDGFYYLNSKDATTLLVDIYGNPPSLTTQGALVSKGDLFGDNNLLLTIDYSAEGHINDEDAENIDYDELVSEMKEATEEESKERITQGYESIDLIGWASTPYYDKTTKKLHWAKEYNFGNADQNTLNYDIRVLGREGTLEVTFISSMAQLNQVKSVSEEILKSFEFTPGNTYAEYNEDTDKTAEYGIAGLVAGGLIMKAAKVGFFAKFWKLILIAGAAMVTFAKKLFSKKSKEA